jgi:hypothetical protein
MNIDQIIEEAIENPTEENVIKYREEINNLEYQTLIEAENFPKKTQEYFNKRSEAFSLQGKYASVVLRKWVEKYKTSNGCFCSYRETLNIPFREIKQPC